MLKNKETQLKKKLGDPEDAKNDGGRTWLECEICKQWFHCDCLHIDNDIIQDKYDFTFKCDNCI